ncbi:hypothetical protein H5410_048526 [Solanum commersonii]|uniref:Cyclic nucleotide-binding domain-containing protein n=1 Tax=Solanum commersonii TaxID=4109 RepID=A0A9J5XLB8_SOLCO|nr:hypothetical protein H5410_048526 [Solanum commersonii]
MNALPKAIRSSIAHYLFLPIVQMSVCSEAFPGTCFYNWFLKWKLNTILPRKILKLFFLKYVEKHIIGKAVARESFGEIGVLHGRPQPYIVTTTEISQILCLSRKTFLNILRDNQENEQIIMRNPVQQDTSTNPSDLISINIQTLEARTKKQVENESESGGREHHIVLDHSVVLNGHIEIALSLLERRCSESTRKKVERRSTRHRISQIGAIGGKSIKKRVTIHMKNNINSLQEQNLKLIILPDTLEELFILVTTRRTDNDS